MSASPDPRTTTATGADVRVRFCPSPDRSAARRADPHGAVQLGVRAPQRRQARLPHRRHRLRARQRGELPAAARRAALARDRLGRGRRGRRTPRSLPAVAAPRHLPRGARQARRRGRGVRELLDRRGDRRPQRGERPREAARLRQLRPRPHRRAEGRVPRRGPRARVAPAGARRGPHLRRPHPRRGDLPRRVLPRLRARARRRRAALPVREPRRRRAHGHHPRASAARTSCRRPRASSRSTARWSTPA